jgi:hypothetical protein
MTGAVAESLLGTHIEIWEYHADCWPEVCRLEPAGNRELSKVCVWIARHIGLLPIASP